MTVIRILLIVGLVYIALQQKKDSTRNKILVVTGILAFCMMGKEGLTQIANVGTASCTDPGTACATALSRGATECPVGCSMTGSAAGADLTCTGVATCALGPGGLQADCEDACDYNYNTPDGPGRTASAPGVPRLTEMKELFPMEPTVTGSVACDTGTIIQGDGTCVNPPTAAEVKNAKVVEMGAFCEKENWVWEEYDAVAKECM